MLHAETAQSSLTVIFKLVISHLTSIILVVLCTVNLQFWVHLFPSLCGQFSELLQFMSCIQPGHYVVNFSTWGFRINKTAHRILLRILSTALLERTKCPWLCLMTTLLLLFSLLWLFFFASTFLTSLIKLILWLKFSTDKRQAEDMERGRQGQARSCSVSQPSTNPPLEHFFLCHLLYLVPLSCQNAPYLPAWSYPPWSTVTSTWCSPHPTVYDRWVPSFLPCLYGKALGLVTMDSCEMLSVESPVKVAQSCPTLCDPIDYTVHGILQARILEWVAFPFSRGSSQPRDRTQVSSIAGRFFTSWATWTKNTGVDSLSLLISRAGDKCRVWGTCNGLACLSSICPSALSTKISLGEAQWMVSLALSLGCDTAGPLSLSLILVVSQGTPRQSWIVPRAASGKDTSCIPHPPWLPFLPRSIAQLHFQLWELPFRPGP